ncbi:MAG: Stk1 family PASTA domain-containing Ser/Thr kinase [Oscillospiraceae bacterium]|nr:Stk1 family PASTA domain-containing Ser/Thr kinase [Oscillospiraceae bacterium]
MDKYIGKRLDGRYEIREVIGVGGMAYVYKAYDTIDDRIVAIKILKDEYLANEEFTRRFKNESKAIAILSHPNIVKVYDVSFGERIQYIVMEYIDGITLKEYIEQQKDIRWKEAVHFTVQILRSLQHAHDKGIVHRDIKPQNIMLLSDGTIKVTDFGIARFSRSDMRLTSAAEKAIGSVHYISPEQVRGEITDEKADIYSVGVMLYEMLTGKLPFEADNAVSVAIMQMQSEPVKLRDINPDIPDGLEEITIKAMQKDPAKRYQSAAEMLYDIDEFKRNPSIHFEYKYFVDETPTRFVEAITRIKGNNPNQDEMEDEIDDEQDEERKGPPVIPILAAVAGAFVLVALLFVGAVTLLGIIGEKPTEEVVVPNFIGQDYLEVANDPENKEKFKFLPTEVHDDTVPKGQIINQDPMSPTRVKLHSEIKLTVSLGPQMIEVPLVSKNEHMDVVRERLEAYFKVQTVSQSSDEVERGFVIKIDPPSGRMVPKNSTIQMYVSTGTDPVPDEPVPDVTAASLETAKKTLTEAGFAVDEVKYANHDTYPRDTVISQEPKKDTLMAPGSKVTLVVASGFRDYELPLVLPDTTTPIDVRIYVAGRHEPEYDENDIIPVSIGLKTIVLKAQKEQYEVIIKIRPHTKGDTEKWQDYLRYRINCITQEKILLEKRDFIESTSTTTEDTPTTSTTNHNWWD